MDSFQAEQGSRGGPGHPTREKGYFNRLRSPSKTPAGETEIKKHHPKWMCAQMLKSICVSALDKRKKAHPLTCKSKWIRHLVTNRASVTACLRAATLCFLVLFGGISPPRAVFLTRASMTVACQHVQLGLGVAGMMETCPSSAPDSIAVLLIKTQRPVFVIKSFFEPHSEWRIASTNLAVTP